MLSEIISASGRTRKDWAAKIGVSAPYLSDLVNGKRVPSLAVAVRIERVTNGAVPASSWLANVDRSDPVPPPAGEDAA